MREILFLLSYFFLVYTLKVLLMNKLHYRRNAVLPGVLKQLNQGLTKQKLIYLLGT